MLQIVIHWLFWDDDFLFNLRLHCLRYKIADVRAVVEKYENIAETLDTVKDKENFLLQCKSTLHPNHFIPFLIKFSLCMVSNNAINFRQANTQRKTSLS